MEKIIEEITSKARSFRRDLSAKTLPINVPFVDVKTSGDRLFLILREDQKLFISQKGDLTIGRWEWVDPMQGLVLSTPASTTLYWIAFCDGRLLILNKHDTNEFRVFANHLYFSEVSLYKISSYLDDYTPNIQSPKITNTPIHLPFGGAEQSMAAQNQGSGLCQICSEKPKLPFHAVCQDCMEFFGEV